MKFVGDQNVKRTTNAKTTTDPNIQRKNIHRNHRNRQILNSQTQAFKSDLYVALGRKIGIGFPVPFRNIGFVVVNTKYESI